MIETNGGNIERGGKMCIRDLGMVIGSHHNGSVAELNERFSHHRHGKQLVCRVKGENLTDLVSLFTASN